MRLSARIVISVCILAVSAGLAPPLQQADDVRSFGAGYLDPAMFIDNSSQTLHQDAAESDEQAPLFGMETEPVIGALAAKWRDVKADIDHEQEVLVPCRAQKACPAVVRELLDIVAEGAGRSGPARVGLINRAVDLAIAPER